MLASSFCFSQERSFLNLDQREHWSRSFVELNPEFSYSGEGINNRYLLQVLMQDTLGSDFRTDQLEALGEISRVGVDYDLGIRAKFRINPKLSGLVKLSDRLHLDAEFPKDAFELAFFGNKSFAGDTAHLSDIQLNLLRYQQLGVGLQWNASPALSGFVLASFLKGEQFQQLSMESASLYTSLIGDTLVAQGRGSYEQSDSGNTGFAAFNGLGGSLTFGMQFVASGRNSDWVIDFLVKDLGWISWNNKSIAYEIDTAIRWTGVEIDNFESFSDSSVNGFDSDSLSEAFLGAMITGSQQSLLPGYAQIQVRQQRDKGWINGMGVMVRWRAGFNPYAWLQSGYQFNEKWSALAYLGYGGYAATQVGVSGSYYGESFFVTLQLQNVEAMVLASQRAGMGARLSLGYRF